MYNGYRLFPGSKRLTGVVLTTELLLPLRFRMSGVIPLLSLWALGAWYRVTLTF
jgi:hypothetical protein